MPRARRRREITVADLLTSSDCDDLTSPSDLDAQDLSEEEFEEDAEHLLSFKFPDQYNEARSESSVLAAISIVTDARTRLTREQLEVDLSAMQPGARDLAQAILDVGKPPVDTEDVYARESGLQYWLICEDGTKRLYSEWIRFLKACPRYIAWVPFDVQDILEGLQFAASDVQQQALEVTFASKPPAIHPSRKRSLDTEEDSVPAKRTKTDFNSAQPAPANTGVHRKHKINGRRLNRWPQSRLNTWEKIMGLPMAKLPAAAFSASRHDLESHCTPVSADIRLCNYPISIEEILTYFPSHSMWRELAQRLRRSWTAQSISSYVIWSRTIRIRNALERTRLQHRLDVADKETFETHSTTVAGSMENISSVAGVQDLKPHDMFVCDLAEGIRHHPTGKGAQLLTRVIQHALKNEDPYDRQLKLSEVTAYATKHNITVPAEVRMGPVAEVEDKAALERHGKAVIEWCKEYTT